MARRFWFACLLLVFVLPSFTSGAQTPPPGKPFSLPFTTPPGVTTWLLSQPYGNTIGAFNYGRYWYAGGRNLHFGIDFWTPCGTPVVAIGDGEVDQVDNFSFGLDPHNLTIFHRDLGITSVYGHLNAKPDLTRGQAVRKGQVIAYSGDPDSTCVSRPHLHLEVRSGNYQIAHNPVNYIEADWVALSNLGYQGFGGFTQDLLFPRRWQTFLDQPDVDFNETPLNEYRYPNPPLTRVAPSPYTPPAFNAKPFSESPAIFRQVTQGGCCAHARWTADSSAITFYDGVDGQLANLIAVNVTGDTTPRPIKDGRYRQTSPDGTLELVYITERTSMIRLADKQETPLATGGAIPAFSPSGSRLLWQRFPADNIPGGIPPLTEVWISRSDGEGRTLLRTQNGGSVAWLDDERLLVIEPIERTNRRTLNVFTLATKKMEAIITIRDLRSVQIAPGGAVLLFYAPFQDDANASGVYGIAARGGAPAVKLPFIGSYRWRDSETVLFLPYEGENQGVLMAFSVTTGIVRALTNPAVKRIRVLNDQWTVSPDGGRVVYWNADDSALWVITLP
ncbi:MAG TPA: M23 family metallopeptidase [Aggregatilineales bacterium]|nr:M23 family metallopeptidase [Anaerolineales bacterium]HRE46778.1 M23 family metallopeptidase [Aggregatilineales bacterium]